MIAAALQTDLVKAWEDIQGAGFAAADAVATLRDAAEAIRPAQSAELRGRALLAVEDARRMLTEAGAALSAAQNTLADSLQATPH